MTEREKREPALTLRITDLPSEGGVYIVSGGVYLRERLPEIQVDGSRPTMPDSKGAIGVHSRVKVDKNEPLDSGIAAIDVTARSQNVGFLGTL